MAIIKRAIGTIGVAWADTVSTQFMHSLSQMLLFSQHELCGKHEYLHYVWGTASYHEIMRNQLVDATQGPFLYQSDTDHQFGPDILARLLYYKKKIKAEVISGIYTYKFPPYQPVANVWGEKGQVIPLGAWHPDTEILEVGPVGGGCLLVETQVFNRIKHELHAPPFNIIQGLSEDYSFCKRCRDLNIKIHLAMKVEAHHLAPRHVTSVQDYVAQFAPAFSAAQNEANQKALEGLKVGIDVG